MARLLALTAALVASSDMQSATALHLRNDDDGPAGGVAEVDKRPTGDAGAVETGGEAPVQQDDQSDKPVSNTGGKKEDEEEPAGGGSHETASERNNSTAEEPKESAPLESVAPTEPPTEAPKGPTTEAPAEMPQPHLRKLSSSGSEQATTSTGGNASTERNPPTGEPKGDEETKDETAHQSSGEEELEKNSDVDTRNHASAEGKKEGEQDGNDPQPEEPSTEGARQPKTPAQMATPYKKSELKFRQKVVDAIWPLKHRGQRNANYDALPWHKQIASRHWLAGHLSPEYHFDRMVHSAENEKAHAWYKRNYAESYNKYASPPTYAAEVKPHQQEEKDTDEATQPTPEIAVSTEPEY